MIVTRYEGYISYDDDEGNLVDYDDHLREVTRLQRARARNLVRSFGIVSECDCKRCKIRKLRADRIAAKYLGEVSHV